MGSGERMSRISAACDQISFVRFFVEGGAGVIFGAWSLCGDQKV